MTSGYYWGQNASASGLEVFQSDPAQQILGYVPTQFKAGA